MRGRYLFVLILVFYAACSFAQPVTITPSSANIQPGESVTLTASGAMYYQWSPATGLSTTEGPIVVASPTVTTTYTCSGYAPGDESVVNSNFDQGNVGFTSDYTFSDNLYPEGTYSVGSNALDFHPDFIGMGHGGSGDFMIVNGSTSPNTNVWTEQITVVPNTYYAFSTWVCTVSAAGDVARLQFSINGNQLGEVFSAPSYTDQWLQFYELWYSENNTAATITILNQNTSGSGNDFGLDDISFCELVLVGAPQCTVYVGSMSVSVTADNTELCEGEATTLHALPVNGSGNYTYNWTPANTLDDPTSQHPVATPNVGTTNYYCHIVDVDWNNSQDVSIAITVHPTYDETTIDTAICSGESYDFFGTSFDHSVTDISHTLFTGQGCDSIVRLNLTVWEENPMLHDHRDLCTGDTLVWFDGNKYYHDGDVAYYDSIGNHGCPQVYKLELSVGEFQTPINYNPNVYMCVPHDQDPYYHWDIADRDYHGNAIDSVAVDDPAGGCPFKYRLNLMFHQEFFSIEEPIIACDTARLPITGETITETDHHVVRTFPSYFGDKICDSTYVFDITINTQSILESDTIRGGCDSVPVIPWPGHETVYFYDNTSPAGHTFQGFTEDSCRLEKTFYIEDMHYKPKLDKLRCASPGAVVYGNLGATEDTVAVVTNTEFFSFQYDFYVEETNSKCVWENCDWSISKPSWAIEFDPEPILLNGKYCSRCKVYVADHDDDFTVLTATIENGCGVDSCKIYLKSSFLDIEENGHSAVNVDIVPNPNNGQMTLLFNHFEGKVDVKVYDVLGTLLDIFETYCDSEYKTLEYNLNSRNGMYFFVISGKEGTIAKKVVIK